MEKGEQNSKSQRIEKNRKVKLKENERIFDYIIYGLNSWKILTILSLLFIIIMGLLIYFPSLKSEFTDSGLATIGRIKFDGVENGVLTYKKDLELSMELEKNPNSKFILIFDCGSTGTRGFLYFYDEDMETRKKGPIKKLLFIELTPGYSTVRQSEIDNYLRVIEIMASLSKKHLKNIEKVEYLGTGGLRLLEKPVIDFMLHKAKKKLESHFENIEITAKIIEGHEEALYGWLSLNYEEKRLFKNYKFGPFDRICGTIEFGGASVQVAYPIKRSKLKSFISNYPLTSPYERICKISLPEYNKQNENDENTIYLYLSSKLGIGFTQMKFKWLAYNSIFPSENGNIEDLCAYKDFKTTKKTEISLKGAANWKKCYEKITDFSNLVVFPNILKNVQNWNLAKLKREGYINSNFYLTALLWDTSEKLNNLKNYQSHSIDNLVMIAENSLNLGWKESLKNYINSLKEDFPPIKESNEEVCFNVEVLVNYPFCVAWAKLIFEKVFNANLDLKNRKDQDIIKIFPGNSSKNSWTLGTTLKKNHNLEIKFLTRDELSQL